MKNFLKVDTETLKQDLPMVKILEEFYREKGTHEYKKADFAEIIAQVVTQKDELSVDIKEIINKISNL